MEEDPRPAPGAGRRSASPTTPSCRWRPRWPESSDQVLSFLRDLAVRSKPFAARDLEQLRAYAAEQGCTESQSWDAGYYAEKLREAPQRVPGGAACLLPVDKVLSGLFAIVERLYGIQIRELHDFERWHADVRLSRDPRERREHVGRFYFDLYARANKRGGAWMDGARYRRRDAPGLLIDPVAYLVCNFTPAVNGKPALLTHDEVTTLFHEFGHGLHHPADPRRACRRLRDQRGGLDAVERPASSWRTGAGNRKAWR
ncbi:M3 family metallopeptidase [Pseudomonas aeruginosa]